MTKKNKKNTQFPEYILRDWKNSDGVNFAIALARITNWILHVDWWTPTDNNEEIENMKPLRVYVGNNSNQIYDLKGKQTISTFSNNIITPILKKRGYNYGGVVSRYYAESTLFNLPLRIRPSEEKIEEAKKFIYNNTEFLSKIPTRNNPLVPADIAAKFTFGKCNPFAEALSELKGFKATAIIAKKYNPIIANNKPGYVHSFVLDQDNNAIDVWGKDTIENIAKRFEVSIFELSESEHIARNQLLKNDYPDKYEEIYNESVRIINEYF
jgi:hypothetical protein